MVFSRLKSLRVDNDLKQYQIGVVLGIRANSYSQIECGVNDLHCDDLIKLCKFYNISADYILGLIDEPRKLH